MAYLGAEAYSESCLYRHIQEYSGIFDTDSYNSINFPFFTLILRICNLKKIYVFLTTMTSIANKFYDEKRGYF